jgi:hypothetical protein
MDLDGIWANNPKLQIEAVSAWLGGHMRMFWWVVLGLATTWGVLKFFLDVHAASLARKEGLRLAHHLAERIAESALEPLEADPSDAQPIASVENGAVPEVNRQAA